MRRAPVAALAFSVFFAHACATQSHRTPPVTVRVVEQTTESTADALGIWVILTDNNGEDHLLFCTAHGIVEINPEKPSGCYDFTPREGADVRTIGSPFRWTVVK